MSRSVSVAAAWLAVLGAVVSPLCAEEVLWPGFLGSNRNGQVDYFPSEVEWPERLTRAWRIEVGSGYGSPAVVGQTAFLHTREENDEVLQSIDLTSGKVNWKKTVATPFKIGGGGEYHGKGPKSCPTYSDGRVFTFGISGVLTAWDAKSGRQLWQRDDGGRFKRSHPNWGACMSPLVAAEKVIIRFGTDEEGELTAFDVATGETVWTYGNEGPSYASPLLAEIGGVQQVVEWNHESLIGVDPPTGDLLWSHPFPHVGTDQNMPTPAVHNGRIYLGAENRGLHCFEPQRNGGEWSVKKRWTQKEIALDMSSAVVHGDRLYGHSHYQKGQLFAVELATGRIAWQGPGRAGQHATFLALPKHIVALLNTGHLKVLPTSTDQYREAASWQVAETQTWAPPVILPTGFLIKDTTTLTFWSLPSPDGESASD